MVVIKINTKNIKKAAKDRGLSTRALAREAGGIGHAAVHKLLTGTGSPYFVTVAKVCHVLGLPIDEAFTTARRRAA